MLSPETIQLMAQTYEEWMHDSSVVARPLETMNWAYQRICAGEDPWTGLGNFSHAWYGYAKDKRAALVGEPLTPPEQQTEYTRRWAAFCAASTEFLCEQYAVACPAWVYESRYSLPQPWSGSNTFPDIVPYNVKTTPLPFAKRNIFCGSGLFKNKYELFEWMLEARRKGITDPRAIRSYAYQKEMSIHGA